jgi:hypothetical protein
MKYIINNKEIFILLCLICLCFAYGIFSSYIRQNTHVKINYNIFIH